MRLMKHAKAATSSTLAHLGQSLINLVYAGNDFLSKNPSQFMAVENFEAPKVFASNAVAGNSLNVSVVAWSKKRTFYNIVHGSSDAVTNILSYLFMFRIYKLMTSLPPLIFSIYKIIQMDDAAGLVFSQSGKTDDLVAFTKDIRETNGKVIALTNQPKSHVKDTAR